MTKLINNYDLEERTTIFSENLIDFLKKYPKTVITIPLIGQGIRSGTSIGANYCEANGASSKKESKETMYWLRLIGRTLDEERLKEECRKLWQEAKELTLIFSKIAFSTKS